MKLGAEIMLRIVKDVRSSLEDDIVSFQELKQIIRNNLEDNPDGSVNLADVITYLLLESDIEIGHTESAENYVKFIAWRKDNIKELVNRVFREVEACADIDKGFVFWFCYSSNVDEWET
jgi:hypothetical protein